MTYYKPHDTWIKSVRPSKTGMWITESSYRIQCMIERSRNVATARYTRRTVRRKLRD